MEMNKLLLLDALKATAQNIVASKELLDDLDRPIGDSDHGVNMARGFGLVLEQIEALESKAISDILNGIAMILILNVGGASGPLYGTAFMKAAKATKGKETLTGHDLIEVYEAVIDGIKMRGKAELGCKTMLDAIIPAYEAFKSSVENGDTLDISAKLATEAAENGVEYTKTIIATKGRASYLGERSIGHQDPGATSSTIILKTFSDQLSKV